MEDPSRGRVDSGYARVEQEATSSGPNVDRYPVPWLRCEHGVLRDEAQAGFEKVLFSMQAPEGVDNMTDSYADDIGRLERTIEELRRQRDRNCEPKNNTNPRYHSYSQAVSALLKVIDDLRSEETSS